VQDELGQSRAVTHPRWARLIRPDQSALRPQILLARMPAPNSSSLLPRSDVVRTSGVVSQRCWSRFLLLLAYGVAIYGVIGPGYVGYGVGQVFWAPCVGLVTPALGGAPRLISAPSAPGCSSAVCVRGGIGGWRRGCGRIGGARTDYRVAHAVGLLSGCLQFLYGAVGGGRLIKYIPYPVVSGVLTFESGPGLG